MPSLALPKGGGAMRGLGEQFQFSAFTGTGSLSIPVVTSAGREGSELSLSLHYDSGNGNGPFGLGVRLSPPSITRRTDRGIPTYDDHEHSDVFVLSGAEDLVPVLVESPEGLVVDRREHDGYRIERYRPRIEAAFSKIERYVHLDSQRTHWRVTDRNNVTSFFGQTDNSRLAMPNFEGAVFQWLLDRVEYDRGNVVIYEYSSDDEWPESELLREGPPPRQRYLRAIRYGNRTPYNTDDGWMFEVRLDYGDHGEDMPSPDDAVVESLTVPYAADRPWPQRRDPFSTRRPGFEVRTRRLCRRVLMFHHFDALGPEPTLVASTDLTYDRSPVASLLRAVNHRGYIRNEDGSYRAESAPPLTLEYTAAQFDGPSKTLDPSSLRDVGGGINGSRLRFVDLDGEGVSGLLVSDGSHWHYKRSRGSGRFDTARVLPHVPNIVGNAAVDLVDLDGNGQLSLAALGTRIEGSFERTPDDGWGQFRTFRSLPRGVAFREAARADLSGDGLADIVKEHFGQLMWWPSHGRDGFGPPKLMPKPAGMPLPQTAEGDPKTLVALADMTGDGLADVVRVTNGVVEYWPNQGYGNFGARVVMTGLRPFDHSDRMRADRVRLADIDGSGTTDLVYFDDRGAQVWINGSGNAFLPPVRFSGLPPAHSLAHVDVLDLEGTGMASVVWSSALPGAASERVRYVQPLSTKPYLLSAIDNGRGLRTELHHAPSTRFYLEDRDAGRPWVTRLPFPVQVLERIETVDQITGHRTVSTYRYHHGYYDGAEREFRGFGLVEQRDAESFEAGDGPSLDVAPVLTKTWFHTGAYLGRGAIAEKLAQEYWSGDPDAVWLRYEWLPSGLRPSEAADAVRALKGSMLRQEVFAEDSTPQASVPYSVREQSMAVRLEQPRGQQRYASVFVHERESVTYHYERVAHDPRLAQSVTLEVDAFGTPVRSAVVGYPRRTPTHAPQGQTSVVVRELDVAHQSDGDGPYRLGVPLEERSYELTEHVANPRQPWSWQAIAEIWDAAPEAPFEAEVSVGMQVRRFLGRQRMLYYADDLSGAAPFGAPGVRALPYETRAAALSEAQRAAVFGDDADAAMLESDGGYLLEDGLWWTRSPRQVFDPLQFYQVVEVVDPFGNATQVAYDDHSLAVTQITDPIGNTVTAQYDYRVLAPTMLTDANGNRTAAGYDGLGQLERSAVLGKPDDVEVDSLAEPTTELEYDLWAWRQRGEPVWMRTRARERHGAEPGRWLQTYAYSDGRGEALMVKARAQLGVEVYDEVLPEPVERWVGSGRTIRNNKGLPVRQYEPFFSTTFEFEDEAELVEHGVTPVLHYDPLGRLVRSELPDGTEAGVEFSPWEKRSFDANDLVVGSRWHTQRVSLPAGDPRRRAAMLAQAHANTPTWTVTDHLGRAFLSVAHNRDDEGTEQLVETRAELDVQGNVLRIIDANGTVAEQRTYGMLGQVLRTDSVEVGQRRMLADVLGAPLWSTDSRGFSTGMRYDAARRPTHVVVRQPDGASFVSTRMVYGNALPNAATNNLRGQLHRLYDGAGVQEHAAFDIDSNLVQQSRRVMVAYDTTPDWSALDDAEDIAAMDAIADGLLEAEVFTTEASFDALGRPITQTTPDGSVVRFEYGDAGTLEGVAANVRGDPAPTDFVTDLRYNARGQRTLVAYGNGTQTRYSYDPQTFRLTGLRTQRVSDGRRHQDLRYTYDPVGNIVEIGDASQPVVFTSNAALGASQRFEYDALYRLVHAEGRELATMEQPSAHDVVPRAMPDDPTGLQAYTERYLYDAVGNILRMQHVAATGRWTRRYDYGDYSHGNRLQRTSAPGDPEGVFSHAYIHDAHGNMTTMPHLGAVAWDHADQMISADLGGGGDVFFQYDAAGQRVRKLRRNVAGTSTWERIYLGSFEVYRERIGEELRLEQQTLHVGDDAGRVCMVETQTVVNGAAVASPANISRYQYGNHLGSVGLELDETGLLISYEEFHPYGTTAYRVANSAIEVSTSRYRYTGKERDEETGLGYHGARYYASWLGRWTAADPIGLGDGINRYAYVRDSPLTLTDLTGTAAQPAADQPMSEQQYQRWVAQQRDSHRQWNAELDDQTVEQQPQAEAPERQQSKPYGADPRGLQQLEKHREQMQQWFDAQYDAARETKASVQASMDRGALWTAAYAGALFGPIAAPALESLGLAGYVRASMAADSFATTVGSVRGGRYLLAFFGAMGEASSVAGGAPPSAGLPMRGWPTRSGGRPSNPAGNSPGGNPKALLSPAPINIPRGTKPVIQSKSSYTQIKYKWRTEGGVTVEARFHGPTPGAPPGSTANWRVSRTFPGTSAGTRKHTEHLVQRADGSFDWVSNKTWYDAQNAYAAGTATEAQQALLRGGHH